MKIYVYRVDNNESFEDYRHWDYYYSSYVDAWNACISYKDNWYNWQDMNHYIYEVELNTNKTILLDTYCSGFGWNHGVNKEIINILGFHIELDKYKKKCHEIRNSWIVHDALENHRYVNTTDSFNKRTIAIRAFKTYAYYRYKFDKFINGDMSAFKNNLERHEANVVMCNCMDFLKKHYNIPAVEFKKMLYAEYLNLIEDIG